VFSHLQESRAPSRVTVTWEDKCHHSDRPPPSFFFSPLCMLSMTSYGMESPFGQWGSAVLAVSPPIFFCTPSLLAGGVLGRADKTLTLCKDCSAVTKTSLCYQHCFQHKSKTLPPTSYYEENYPSQNQHKGVEKNLLPFLKAVLLVKGQNMHSIYNTLLSSGYNMIHYYRQPPINQRS